MVFDWAIVRPQVGNTLLFFDGEYFLEWDSKKAKRFLWKDATKEVAMMNKNLCSHNTDRAFVVHVGEL